MFAAPRRVAHIAATRQPQAEIARPLTEAGGRNCEMIITRDSLGAIHPSFVPAQQAV